MAKISRRDVRRVRRALAEIDDLRERNDLVQGAVKTAAVGNKAILLMATVLSNYIKMMGQPTALELLATLGWWLIENGAPDDQH
jgi:hypothetical protein